MKSTTKYLLDNNTIQAIFKNAGFTNITNIAPLTAGEFNSAYVVKADGKEFVLKVAPKEDTKVLTYEKDIMPREIYFYNLIKEQTNVKTPEIFAYDDSKKIIDTKYFIMEKLDSTPLFNTKLSKEDKSEAIEKIGELIGDLHNIKGEKYGYIQNGLHDNWYEAIKSMTQNLINDCKRVGKKAKNGEKLLSYIEKYKDILISVECTYTHFDIWEGNVFYNKNKDVNLTLIDTERSFWGDKLGDFVSLDVFNSLADKKELIKGYNNTAKEKLTLTNKENIRYYILVAYLALIVYSEKFIRYSKLQIKYISNIFLAKSLFKKAFKELEK